MSSDNPFTERPSGPLSPPNLQSSRSTLVFIFALAGISILLLGLCAGLWFPAMQGAREAARRASCANHLKQIGLAMHTYHDVYGAFPPAYTVGADGQPLHSWRTLLLPFVEQQALYDRIDLSKPWDDPVNQAVAEIVVPVYSCPSMSEHPKSTPYVAIDDAGGIMSGSNPSTKQSITAGLADTILLTETNNANAVPWMSPRDITLATFLSAGGTQASSSHIGGTHILMADGSVKFIADSMDFKLRRAMVAKVGDDV